MSAFTNLRLFMMRSKTINLLLVNINKIANSKTKDVQNRKTHFAKFLTSQNLKNCL